MDLTSRLGLNKPDPDPLTGDFLDVEKLNENFDKLDGVAGATPCTSGTRPSSPFAGQFARETDTGRVIFWDGTDWQTVYNPAGDSAWTQINAPTVTWTNTGSSNPTLGNGALIFRYLKMGRKVDWALKLFWGSSTTGGDNAGFWSFGGLPSSLDRTVTDLFYPGAAWDVSALNLHDIQAQASPTSGGTFLNRIYGRNASGTLQRIGPTAPFTWASGDIMQISGAFEAASV